MKSAKNSYEDAVSEILSKLTLAGKIALCSGKNEWETKEISHVGKTLVLSVRVADGPHGLRKTVGEGDNMGFTGSYPATCFPAESLLAASFDKDLAYEMGAQIAQEARANDVCTFLGPGVNMKRNPLCGRNFEYLSEDPFLAGRMAASYIRGANSKGIGTSLKHFACNSQEHFRMVSDSKIGERTLREIYLPAFEYAVKKGKPATVMCAYNRINGISCSDNAFLLDQILRQEWGYQGMVVSDWGALHNRIEAFKAGCDLIMPGGAGFEEDDVKKAVKDGTLSEKYVDRSAGRVIRFALRQSVLLEDRKKKYTKYTKYTEKGTEKQALLDAVHQDSHELARKIAEESAVLLKNDEAVLPLDFTKEDFCIIGSMAKTFRYQGSGSSKIHAVKKDDLFEEIAGVSAEKDADLSDLLNEIPYAEGYKENGNTDDKLIARAKRLAKKHDKVLLFVGLPEQYEAEGMDRNSMKLPEGEDRLVEEIAEVNPNIIVVLICGCVVEIPWIDRVKGLLWMGLSGEAGASALVRILDGEVNPSGKLAESWPICYEDCPSADTYLKEGHDAVYREGIYIGYRYYDSKKVPVRFPFGYGLSYTEFLYSNLQVKEVEDHFEVQVTVKNIGTHAGKEAVLLYVHAPQDGIDRPVRELKGFHKVFLAPSESKNIRFRTDDRTFAVWDDGWKVYAGEYTIEIGELFEEVAVSGEIWDDSRKKTEGCFPDVNTTDAQSSADGEEAVPAAYDVDSTISELAEENVLIRKLYEQYEKKQAGKYGYGTADYLAAMRMAEECPVRAMQNFMKLPNHTAQALADFGNGNYLAGIGHLVK